MLFGKMNYEGITVSHIAWSRIFPEGEGEPNLGRIKILRQGFRRT